MTPNGNGNGDEEEVQGLVVDQVLRAIQVDQDGNMAVVFRSGEGTAALVLTPEQAREVADLMLDVADQIEGK